MRITPIPCLSDNYAYLLVCEHTGKTAVVDPSEPEPLIAALTSAGLQPSAILCTHHHGDHVGGVEGLLERFGNSIPVYGHASETARIPRLSLPVADGAEFTVGDVRVRVLHVPGHTLGAVGFVANERAVFTGDTMFVAGCGRLFEGTAEMMHRSLNEVFGALGNDVAVYPGHEYAEKNLRFAASVEPGNAAIRDKLATVRSRRENGEFCVPSSIADERATNPFMRVTVEEVRTFAAQHEALDASDPVQVLAAIRKARDSF